MDVSVVIPTLNEERHIGGLLSDLGRQTRRPDEVIVVDGESSDATVSVVESFSGVTLLHSPPSVSRQRNAGGLAARGDVIFFLDADVRLPEAFFEGFLEQFGRRRLDLACPLFTVPEDSTAPVKGVHAFFNVAFIGLQKLLPSGSGQCIAVRRELFQGSAGFDTSLRFADDIELIRRLSRHNRFGIVTEKIVVSDRRFRERGVGRATLTLLLLSVIFATGRFELSNRIEYEFGEHDS